jgi:hypothetical protein
VNVASLRAVIRFKEAVGRDKDLAQLPLLRRTLEQIRERDADRRSSNGRPPDSKRLAFALYRSPLSPLARLVVGDLASRRSPP